MAKLQKPEAALIYDVARQFVDRCLQANDSLFTPGEPVWTPERLDDLYDRFIGHPDESDRRFLEKFKGQVETGDPLTIQLAGEALYVHFLISNAVGGDRKREVIREVLGWSPGKVEIPGRLNPALDSGICHTGVAFNTYRPNQLGYVLRFARRWKDLSQDERATRLGDPWEFKNFAHEVEARAAYVQRQALLHLIFPDTFEPMVSRDAKKRIVERFNRYLDPPSNDVDRNLLTIRKALEEERDRPIESFYDDEIVGLWQPDTSRWGQLVQWAKKFHELDGFYDEESAYKLEIADGLAQVREKLLAEDRGWLETLRLAIVTPKNNLTSWQVNDSFSKWAAANPHEAKEALTAIWMEDAGLEDRIRGFLERVPQTRGVVAGMGTRASLASFLVMALAPESYPIYRPTPFQKGFELTDYPPPENDADEAQIYSHALGFLDKFAEEASARGLELQNRLEAQSLLWGVTKWEAPFSDEENYALERYRQGAVTEDGDGPDGGRGTPAQALDRLADELLLDKDYLQRVGRLLEHKGQVIFHGPPGTGKTYIAQKLARHLAGGEDRVELVQFHPSYAYEDFIEGYRPTQLDNGQPGFKLGEGPLKRIAQAAAAQPQAIHVLIIDEVNRGNVAKVFGELYFLLEYRRRDVSLQYSAEPFSLPENLWIIGTMNTADRSIALVDAALRRRFHFVPFFPDEPPIEGLLRRWLERNKPDLLWIADAVEGANERLDDRNMAVGPSHFMDLRLDEELAHLVWEHSVLPYIAEQFHGQPERVEEFRNLLRESRSPLEEDENDETHADGGDLE